MKNVLNFVVQTTLYTAQLAVKSIQHPANAVIVSTVHADAGLSVLRNSLRNKIVPNSPKNKVVKRMPYKDMVLALTETNNDMHSAISGGIDFTDFMNKSIRRIVNVDELQSVNS